MKNRLKRIGQLADLLKLHDGEMPVEEVCSKLDVTPFTLKRYIKSITSSEFEVILKNGCIKVLKYGALRNLEVFSKTDYVMYRILFFIYNNNPCPRARIREHLCEGDEDTSITVRYLDMHISKLIVNGYIEKCHCSGKLGYKIAGRILPVDSLPFEVAIGIFNFLNVYRNSLPFQDKIETILDKLGGAMANYVRTSSEALESVKIAYEVFPDSFIRNVDDTALDELAVKLESFCKSCSTVRVRMRSGFVMRVVPFFVLYNWTAGNWYLICRTTHQKDGYDMLRLDHMESAEWVGHNERMSEDRFISEREAVRKELEETYASGLEEAIEVRVVFQSGFYRKDTLLPLLSSLHGNVRELPEGSLYFCGRIARESDFLAWLRRFGSGAVILSPDGLRRVHYAGAIRTCNQYSDEGGV